MLLDKYSQYQHSTSQRSYDTVSDGVYVSKTGMTLDEFCFACDACCKQKHNQSRCLNCSRMMYAARIFQEEAVCSLSALFREAFRGVKYTSESAKQRLLRMPLACIRVENL